jgi:hypothetical protein
MFKRRKITDKGETTTNSPPKPFFKEMKMFAKHL